MPTSLQLELPKRQLQALIIAIRPSILWRVDAKTPPLDLLDDNGIAGWRVGVSALLPVLSKCDDPGAKEVYQWLDLDQRREEARWHDPQAALTLALEVLRPRSWGAQRDPIVLDQWLTNIDAALSRYPLKHTSAPPFAQRQAVRLHSLLAQEPGTEVTRRQLTRLAQAKPASRDTTPHLGCLSLAGRAELRAIGRWLEIEGTPQAQQPAENPSWQITSALEAASA